MRTRHFAVALAVALSFTACSSMPVEQLKVKSSLLTTGGDDARFKRVPLSSFSEEDRVFFVTTVEWADLEKSAGRHDVRWTWSSNGKVVTVLKREYVFNQTPFELLSTMPASALGKGPARVELQIDSKPFASTDFTVR